jgi:hypothetical protein
LFFVFTSKNEVTPTSNIADTQKISSVTEAETLKVKEYISPEKQKQLNQITEIYSSEELAHHAAVTNIMRKYNSNFSQDDEALLLSIIELSSSPEELTKAAKEKLSINFLQTDIRIMLESKEKLTEEKQLELTRLELFYEKNNQDINSNTQKLIELSIIDSLKNNSTLDTSEITSISRDIAQELFTIDSSILDIDT